MRRRSVARVSSVLLLAAFALVALRLQAQTLLRSLVVPVQFSAYWRPAANGTSSSPPSPVERIYYINLKKNTERRRQMEGWLGRQPIPYQRVEATAGADSDPCPQGASKERCRGIAGLARTNLAIIRSRNVSGLTLVFEDDYVVERDLAGAVRDTLGRVPDDWDIIRWDCVGPVRSSFPVLLNARDMVVFRTAHLLPCRGGANESYCTFCGSTHAMLWRDASLPKIEALWAKQPFDDIDCRLVTTAINSYCVNMGLGVNRAPESEWSDITYIRPRNATS
jgi:hypothetical protein